LHPNLQFHPLEITSHKPLLFFQTEAHTVFEMSQHLYFCSPFHKQKCILHVAFKLLFHLIFLGDLSTSVQKEETQSLMVVSCFIE
jgi:hypothetical protein